MAVTYSGDAATTRTNLGLGSLATLSAVGAAQITDNSVSAAELNVSGNGTAGQFLSSDGDGSFSWTYSLVTRSTTSGTAVVGDTGKCIALSAGITIPASTFAAGAAVSLYNNTAGDLTITQGGGLTMYLSGDGSTGNRTLATRGLMTIWFNTTTDCVCGGPGVS